MVQNKLKNYETQVIKSKVKNMFDFLKTTYWLITAQAGANGQITTITTVFSVNDVFPGSIKLQEWLNKQSTETKTLKWNILFLYKLTRKEYDAFNTIEENKTKNDGKR